MNNTKTAANIEKRPPMNGAKLKQIRKDNEISQDDLADLLQMGTRGRTTISEWENDRVAIGPGYELAILLMFRLVPQYTPNPFR